jgi:predicted porin
MKKSLIALAVLAAASGAAMAQSSVTLFGIVDAGVGRVSGGGHSVTGLTNSGIASSRLGFRGVEDLGGGLSAGFWLEGGMSNDTGTGAGGGAAGPGFEFKRRSTISLMGNFGEVRLGRELTVGYVNSTAADVFGDNGVGASIGKNHFAGVIETRKGNGISYILPSNLGGIYGQVQYVFGETASNAAYDKTGDYFGARVGYRNGPLDTAIAFAKGRGATAAQDADQFNIFASYDLGVVKPFIGFNQEKNKADVQTKFQSYLLGLTAPVGPGTVRLSYNHVDQKNSDNDANKLAVGYVYDLSKRTALYGTYAHVNNKGAATFGATPGGLTFVTPAGQNVNGYEFGVRHSF